MTNLRIQSAIKLNEDFMTIKPTLDSQIGTHNVTIFLVDCTGSISENKFSITVHGPPKFESPL